MDPTLNVRKAFKADPTYGHSAFLLFKDDVEIKQQTKGPCYSSITYNSGLQADRLFLFFGKSRVKWDVEAAEAWCKWGLNESLCADAFITKDPSEGFKTGFEVRTDIDRALMNGAMSLLRHQFEFRNWAWHDFVKMGFSEFDAYVLANSFVVEDGEIDYLRCNTNHQLMRHSCAYGAYRGDDYSPRGEYYGTLKTGQHGSFTTMSSENFGATPREIDRGDYVEKKATKELLEKFIETLKGL